MTRSLLLLAAASVGFGLQGIFSRLAYDGGADVAGVIAARSLAVLPLLLVFLVPRADALRRRAEWRHVAPMLVVMGLLLTGAAATYFAAIDRMSPALVTLIIYLYPALTIIGSRLLGWTALHLLTGVAILCTLTGVALTVGLPDGGIDPLAVALCVANAFIYSCYLLLAQSSLRRADPVTVYASAGGMASILLVAGSFALAEPHWPTDGPGIAGLVGVAVVSTLLASVIQLVGIRHVGSAQAALVTSLEVVTVVVASAVILDEPIGMAVALGSVLVIAGAGLAPLAAPRRASMQEPA